MNIERCISLKKPIHRAAAISFLKDNRTDYNELYMDLLNELS